ncbi:MAG TPA: cytochrome P460 family protein [Planctomycetota bacterium]|nr:cytochrome P460 family protein [Planctomycetota bacterium]
MRHVIVFIILVLFCPISSSAETNKLDDLSLLNAIKSRAEGDKVTAKPVYMTNPVSLLCRAPGPTDASKKVAADPHVQTWIQVFAENLSSASFKETDKPLPAGAIVIKEKHHSDKAAADGAGMPADAKLELFTVMLKREAGYNPDGGDWEYAVVNGDASRVLARGKIESCMECHRIKVKTDFLYRSYLGQAEVDKAMGR